MRRNLLCYTYTLAQLHVRWSQEISVNSVLFKYILNHAFGHQTYHPLAADIKTDFQPSRYRILMSFEFLSCKCYTILTKLKFDILFNGLEYIIFIFGYMKCLFSTFHVILIVIDITLILYTLPHYLINNLNLPSTNYFILSRYPDSILPNNFDKYHYYLFKFNFFH